MREKEGTKKKKFESLTTKIINIASIGNVKGNFLRGIGGGSAGGAGVNGCARKIKKKNSK